MAPLDLLVDSWSQAHWEFTLAFEGLTDDKLWLRPYPQLLSVGELAGHAAYWESFNIHGPDNLPVSPLVDKRFYYYSKSMEIEPVVLPLTVVELAAEFERIFNLNKDALLAAAPELDAKSPWREEWTWKSMLQYIVFHTAYHCGQAYSVRHLLGDETTDN